jgi:hypothetical protein
MKTRLLTGAVVMLVVTLVLLVAPRMWPFLSARAFAALEDPTEKRVAAQESPYHKHPPKGTPPETLDPAEFKDNAAAFTAYSLAAEIRDLLYQEPCLCPCRKTQGHQSLLDCYRSRHGVACHACQMELFFIFAARQRGKSPKEIRNALFKNEWKSVNIDRFVAEYKIATDRK